MYGKDCRRVTVQRNVGPKPSNIAVVRKRKNQEVPSRSNKRLATIEKPFQPEFRLRDVSQALIEALTLSEPVTQPAAAAPSEEAGTQKKKKPLEDQLVDLQSLRDDMANRNISKSVNGSGESTRPAESSRVSKHILQKSNSDPEPSVLLPSLQNGPRKLLGVFVSGPPPKGYTSFCDDKPSSIANRNISEELTIGAESEEVDWEEEEEEAEYTDGDTDGDMDEEYTDGDDEMDEEYADRDYEMDGEVDANENKTRNRNQNKKSPKKINRLQRPSPGYRTESTFRSESPEDLSDSTYHPSSSDVSDIFEKVISDSEPETILSSLPLRTIRMRMKNAARNSSNHGTKARKQGDRKQNVQSSSRIVVTPTRNTSSNNTLANQAVKVDKGLPRNNLMQSNEGGTKAGFKQPEARRPSDRGNNKLGFPLAPGIRGPAANAPKKLGKPANRASEGRIICLSRQQIQESTERLQQKDRAPKNLQRQSERTTEEPTACPPEKSKSRNTNATLKETEKVQTGADRAKITGLTPKKPAPSSIRQMTPTTAILTKAGQPERKKRRNTPMLTLKKLVSRKTVRAFIWWRGSTAMPPPTIQADALPIRMRETTPRTFFGSGPRREMGPGSHQG